MNDGFQIYKPDIAPASVAAPRGIAPDRPFTRGNPTGENVQSPGSADPEFVRGPQRAGQYALGATVEQPSTAEETVPAAGGDIPDNTDPPNRTETAFADDDEPIEPGGVVHIKLGAEINEDDRDWQDGPDDAYFNPDEPQVAYTAAGTITVARATETNTDDSPMLQGVSEGCQITTFHHGETQIGAMMHVGAEDVIEQAQEMAGELLDAFPVLSEPTTQVHIYCTREILTPKGEPTNTGAGLKDFLQQEYGMDGEKITIVPGVPEGLVMLDVATGYTEGGPPDADEPTYSYIPPEPTA